MVRVYQFKITLRLEPSVWRSILISENTTFREFHLLINNSMGLSTDHLHEFKIKNPSTNKTDTIGFRFSNDSMEPLDGRQIEVKDYFVSPGLQCRYTYDLGASLEHIVLLEKILEFPSFEKPRCIAGKRACPPEYKNSDDEDFDQENFEPGFDLVPFDGFGSDYPPPV